MTAPTIPCACICARWARSSLLSREGEIAIAKRIEAGRELMIGALCESPLTFEALTVWRDELNEGKVLLRDIIDLEAMYGAGPDGQAAAAAVGRRRWPARHRRRRRQMNGHDAARAVPDCRPAAAQAGATSPPPRAQAAGRGKLDDPAEAQASRRRSAPKPTISTTKAICRCRRWKPR